MGLWFILIFILYSILDIQELDQSNDKLLTKLAPVI